MPLGARYIFKPGPDGPVSAILNRDIARLVAEGLLEAQPQEHDHWSSYRASDAGQALADHMLQRIAEDQPGARDAARTLFDIKTRLASEHFADLLRRVEREHPKAARPSVFAQPRQP